MPKASTVKEAVKETLVGSREPAQLSAQTKARFNRHAVKDPETGELYLGPEQFIDAVAPPHEDYVSSMHDFVACREPQLTLDPVHLAQNQTGAVLDPIPRRRPNKQGQSDTGRLGVL